MISQQVTQLAAHWPQLRFSPIPLITFLRPAEMLDKNAGEVVEPCDAKMLSYVKSDVPNLGQFDVLWREEVKEEVEAEKEERPNHSHSLETCFLLSDWITTTCVFTLSCFTALKVFRLHW